MPAGYLSWGRVVRMWEHRSVGCNINIPLLKGNVALRENLCLHGVRHLTADAGSETSRWGWGRPCTSRTNYFEFILGFKSEATPELQASGIFFNGQQRRLLWLYRSLKEKDSTSRLMHHLREHCEHEIMVFSPKSLIQNSVVLNAMVSWLWQKNRLANGQNARF